MNFNIAELYKENFKLFYQEDQIEKNFNYLSSLPQDVVKCRIHIKDDLCLAGLPFFFESFNFLSKDIVDYRKFLSLEGESFKKTEKKTIEFTLPFNIALSGERIALNLLQKASSIATHTQKYVSIAGDVKILDTRKTTPGLRFIEKYATKVGGAFNHRFAQTDAWMVKDNHKSFFGGVAEAIEFFKKQSSFYQPIVVEIHDLSELEHVAGLGIKHFMLDNFDPEDIQRAVKLKRDGMTFEVSGGITLLNLESYIIDGVDAISSGSLTYAAPPVDISLKFGKDLY